MIFFRNIQNKRLNRYKSLLKKYEFINNEHQYSIKNCMDKNKLILVSINNEQEWIEVGTLFCDKGKLQFCGNSKFTDPKSIVNWEYIMNGKDKDIQLCGWLYDGALVYSGKVYWEIFHTSVTYITAKEFIENNNSDILRLRATKQSILSYKSNNGIKTSK